MSKDTWNMISNLIVAIVPVFMTAAIGYGAWVTGEVYACRYEMVTDADCRQLEEDVNQYTDHRYGMLLGEINRLREAVVELQRTQAETLAEVRMLREHLHKKN